MPRILALLVSLFALTANAADLATGFYLAPENASPGDDIRFGGSIVNDDTQGLVAAPRLRITFAEAMTVRALELTSGGPSGWNCSTSPGLVDCTHTDLRPRERAWFELILRMPAAREGGRYTIASVATTSSPDPKPENNRAERAFTVTRVIPVVFYDELKPAIEEANQFCTGDVPCSIPITLHPELLRDIHLTEPLPVVTACNLKMIVPRGGADFPPPVVTLHGDGLKSGNGLELRSACNGSIMHVEGLNFVGFPENGIAITGEKASRTTVRQSFISGNGLRGVAIANPHADTTIEYSTIAGNRASGVAVWLGAQTTIRQSDIGTRAGVPQPNGASGVFVSSAGGRVTVAETTIANHPHFGITAMAGASLSLSTSAGVLGDEPNRFTNNANLDVDWNVDGPTPNDEDETDGVPNAPRILSARYDAASNTTRVTVDLHTRAGQLSHYFEVFLYAGTKRTMFGTAEMERLVARKPAATERNDGEPVNVQVTLEIKRDLRGQFLSAQTAVWAYPPDDWPDMPALNMSELSAGVPVE